MKPKVKYLQLFLEKFAQRKREQKCVLLKRVQTILCLGVPRPEGAGSPSQPIEVVDMEKNETTIYNSMSEAARALNINKSRISTYFSNNQKKPYKGRYIFHRPSLSN